MSGRCCGSRHHDPRASFNPLQSTNFLRATLDALWALAPQPAPPACCCVPLRAGAPPVMQRTPHGTPAALPLPPSTPSSSSRGPQQWSDEQTKRSLPPPVLPSCFPSRAPYHSSMQVLQLFLLRRALEFGPGYSPIPQWWYKPTPAEFLVLAAAHIRDADRFPPWIFIVDVCMSTEALPVSEYQVSPVWRHDPRSPQRTVFVSDSCLTAYDEGTQESIALCPKEGKPRPYAILLSAFCDPSSRSATTCRRGPRRRSVGRSRIPPSPRFRSATTWTIWWFVGPPTTA